MLSLHSPIEENNTFEGTCVNHKINFNSASLKDIMSLKNIDKQTAADIFDFAKDTTITDNYDLLELESIDINMLDNWTNVIEDMRININYTSEKDLQKVKGVGKKLARKIFLKKEDLGSFKNINQLKQIEDLNKNTFENIKLRFKI